MPQTKDDFFRQGMAELAGQQADLTAMVGVVREEVADEMHDVRGKTSHFTASC